jgi:hypothetical protein
MSEVACDRRIDASLKRIAARQTEAQSLCALHAECINSAAWLICGNRILTLDTRQTE